MVIAFKTKTCTWFLDYHAKTWTRTPDNDKGEYGTFTGQPVVKIGWPVTIHSPSEDHLSKIIVTGDVLSYNELLSAE